jgi:CRP/FNR family nitrogen fixation transcriptional regulator
MTALALQARTSPALAFTAAAAGDCLPEERSPLALLGTISRFNRNTTIFGEGDDAAYSYKLITGCVRLSKIMSDGRRQIAEFALPGDFFGINWLDEHALTAEALTDVSVICYGRRRLERLGDENSEVRAELFSTLRHDLWAAQNHLVILGRQSALERVASFLVQLIERSKGSDKTMIDLPMSRLDIADYLGLTIETVCRMLATLKRRAIIGIPNRQEISVRNLSALRRAARPQE